MSIAKVCRHLLSLAYRLERTRLLRAVALMYGGYVATPLVAVALGRFTDSALSRRAEETFVLALVVGCLLVAELMLGYFAHIDHFAVAERQSAALRAELIDVVNGTRGVEHFDNPEFADTAALVREALAGDARALEASLQLGGLVLQIGITGAVLISLDPWLAVLPLFALPPVLIARKAQGVLERARESSAESNRLSRHFLELATRANSVKELRVFGDQAELVSRHERSWSEVTRQLVRGQAVSGLLRAAGQIVFALGYAAALLLAIRQLLEGHASVGDQVLVITLAVQVNAQVGGTLQLISVLQSAGATLQRLEKLKSMASPIRGPSQRAYDRSTVERGIVLENVSFCYPGASTPVLRDLNLTLPAGRTLALVGENGAGKSTLIKLLCGLYAPTAGRILVDGVDLAELDPATWRARVGSLFQDFMRIELKLGESIGLGEADLLSDADAVHRAVAQGRGESVVAVVPGRLDGLVGRSYGDGAELSGGQWQTLGLCRTLMRERAHLLILDEPAAALDPAAEHALFERYSSSARAAGHHSGAVTVLVSHRFSTVLMADAIAVLAGGSIVEHGTHRELIETDGLYSQLFALQARAYAASAPVCGEVAG